MISIRVALFRLFPISLKDNTEFILLYAALLVRNVSFVQVDAYEELV